MFRPFYSELKKVIVFGHGVFMTLNKQHDEI
jgi:hypothetical protein